MSHYSSGTLKSLYHKAFNEDKANAHIYLKKMLVNAESKSELKKVSKIQIEFAILEKELGNYKNAIRHINKADSISKKLKDETLEAECILKKGNINYAFGNYDKAFELYISSYNYYKNTGHKKWTNGISHNIALIKNVLGDQEDALHILLTNYTRYNNASIEVRKKEFSPYFYTNTLMAISDAYIRKAVKNPIDKTTLLDSAFMYNQLGYEITLEKNDIIGNSYFTAGKGTISYEREIFTQALSELDEAVLKVKESKESNLLTSIYYYKGLSFKKLHKIDSTIVYLKKVDSISKKNSINYPILQHAYYTLGEIYKNRKDSINILKYQNLYVENDRVNERITGTVRQDIHEKYDIKLLNSEIKTLTKTTKKQKEEYTKAIIIIVILLALFIVFFIFYRQQQQKNKLVFEKLMLQLNAKPVIKKPQPNTNPIQIDDEKVIQILKQIDKFEEKKLFLDRNCDLAFVAKKAKTNKAYLSKIIHTHKQLKFIDYIRNLRIDYALKKLKDDKVFRSYDIKSIAEESGFKSSDSFSRAFVKNTGIYPSFYIKNINKLGH